MKAHGNGNHKNNFGCPFYVLSGKGKGRSERCHWATKYLGIPPNLPMIRCARSGARFSSA